MRAETWLRASAHAQWPARQAHSVVVYRSAPSPSSLEQRALAEDTLLRGAVIRASRAPVVAATSHRPLAVVAAPAVPQPQQDMLLLMGGTGGVGEYLNDVWSSRDGFLWQQVQGSAAWPARAAFCALELQGQLFVMAGVDGATLYNDVWVSSDGGGAPTIHGIPRACMAPHSPHSLVACMRPVMCCVQPRGRWRRSRHRGRRGSMPAPWPTTAQCSSWAVKTRTQPRSLLRRSC